MMSIPWDSSALTAIEKAVKARMVVNRREMNLVSVICWAFKAQFERRK